jgi:hypothetical protein
VRERLSNNDFRLNWNSRGHIFKKFKILISMNIKVQRGFLWNRWHEHQGTTCYPLESVASNYIRALSSLHLNTTFYGLHQIDGQGVGEAVPDVGRGDVAVDGGHIDHHIVHAGANLKEG